MHTLWPLGTHTNPNCRKFLNPHSRAADATRVQSLLTQYPLNVM
jgi:hypothetical protein